jgi:ADP-ribose pyrophosphatase YjhB (NUDIX family)
MLTFSHNKGRFNFRTVAVILHQGQVLIHRAEKDSFWTLPGGRVEFGEPSSTALIREIREELGIKIEVERLLWLVENFFTYEAEDYHEVALYFLVKLPTGSALYTQKTPIKGDEEGIPLIFQWHRIEALTEIELCPTFLKESLREIPDSTTYVIHQDGK